MDCAEEVSLLKREVGPVVGGEEHLSFDLLNGRMTVMEGASAPSFESVLQAVRLTGMRAELWEGDNATEQKTIRQWLQFALMVVGGFLLTVAFVVHAELAGGFRLAFGSEGMGIAQGVPLPAKLFRNSVFTAM